MNSYLPSFIGLPPGGASDGAVDDSQLESMSRDELRAMVVTLQTEMLRSHDQQHNTTHPMNSTARDTTAARDMSCATVLDYPNSTGVSNASSSAARRWHPQHDQQFDADLEQILHETEMDRQRLKREMDVILFGPKSNEDVRVIPVLKQRLQAALLQLQDKVSHSADQSDDVTASLRKRLRHSEACVARLTRQIELNSDCREFNPDLVCQMALEIERLKDIVSREVKQGQGHASTGSRSSDTGGSSGSGDERADGGRREKRSRDGV